METKPVGQNVLIYDGQWRHKAFTTADYLADKGKKVQIIAPTPMVGLLAGVSHMTLSKQRMFAKGVTLTSDTQPVHINGNTVTVVDVTSYQPRNIEGIDTFIYCTYNQASDKLYQALKGKVKRLEIIGDAWGPRSIMHGISDAFHLMREI